MLICHLYIFFGEMPVKIFGPFFDQVVSFEFKGLIYEYERTIIISRILVTFILTEHYLWDLIIK